MITKLLEEVIIVGSTLTIEEWKAAQGTNTGGVRFIGSLAKQRDTAYPRRVERSCQSSLARL